MVGRVKVGRVKVGNSVVGACRGRRGPPEGQVALGAQGAPESWGTAVDPASRASPVPKQPVEGCREGQK